MNYNPIYEVEELSQGRVKFTPYWAGSLFESKEALQSFQAGVADCGALWIGDFPAVFELNYWTSLPFLGFPSAEVATRVYREVYDKFPEMQAEYGDVKVLWFYSATPYANVATIKERPVRSLEDFKGLKLSMGSPNMAGRIMALGGSAEMQSPADVYLSLQNKVIDGTLAPFAVMLSRRWAEFCVNVTEVNFGNMPFYVVINVTSDGNQSGTATPTAYATGSGSVSGLSISAATASYRGECPFTFTFNVQVTMASPDRVTLRLEAGASDPTYQFSLPPAQSYDLGVGPNAFSYFLELTDSVDGWAQVRLTTPEILVSNQAAFSLTCE